jgi:hypothetical protein
MKLLFDTANQQRLSWHLSDSGGWRLGNIRDLNYDTQYYKMVFLKI